jgi:hypothetical protein
MLGSSSGRSVSYLHAADSILHTCSAIHDHFLLRFRGETGKRRANESEQKRSLLARSTGYTFVVVQGHLWR